MMIRKIIYGISCSAIFCLFSCSGVKTVNLDTYIKKKDNDAFRNIRFGASYNDFVKSGYDYSDMITMNIKDFDGNGNDLSYDVAMVTNYNEVGYFVPCLCNYENSRIDVDFSFGIDTKHRDMMDVENKTVTFSMKSKGGYDETRQLVKSDRKLTYDESDHNNHMYANFRDVATTTGELLTHMQPNLLFRGSSPFNYVANADRNRRVDELLKSYNINYEISLGNDDSKIENFMNNITERSYFEYSYSLYQNRNDATDPKFCSAACAGDYFTIHNDNANELRDGNCMQKVFRFMLDRIDNNLESPSFFVHCDEGKDRTSFVCMVIEALAGASLNDIVDDFMLTFKNYYNISSANDKKRYDRIAELNIYRFLYSLLLARDGLKCGEITDALTAIDWYNFNTKEAVINKIGNDSMALYNGSINYLKETLGLSDLEIGKIKSWITTPANKLGYNN